MIKTITIHAREIKTEKNKFISSSTKIGNTYYKVKFVQTCERSPREKGLFELTFDTLNASIQNGKKYITKDGYEALGNPTIWIKKITDIRKFTDEELSEISEAKFAGVFAEDEV